MPPLGSLPERLAQIASRYRIPGWSIAAANSDGISVVAGGVRNVTNQEPVGSDTIFEAASLSKPVFARAVLQLAEQSAFSLDEPLKNVVPDFLSGDLHVADITARHVLSHTTGLPNWRSDAYPLKTYFRPGTRFSYSGEGFVYLQRVVEKITGETTDAFVRRFVFDPLRMVRSSYIWRPDFDADHADPHDRTLHSCEKYRPSQANAAFSLHTTAADYARFLQAVVSGGGLGSQTALSWLLPQVEIRSNSAECLHPNPLDIETGLAWGLGWGLDMTRQTFFQWGDNPGFKAFAIGSISDQTAMIVLTNSDGGASAMSALVAPYFAREQQSLSWLGWNSPT